MFSFRPNSSEQTQRTNESRSAKTLSRHLRLAVEQLEGRECPSVFYDYDIMARTGQDGVGASIQPAVSINDSGAVAFVAASGSFQDVFVATGPLAVTGIASAASNRTYGNEVQINNSNQVAAVAITSGSTVSRNARIYTLASPGSFTNVGLGSTPLANLSHFDSLGAFVSMTNDGQVAFAGLEADEPVAPSLASSWEIHLADGSPVVDSRDLLNTALSEVAQLSAAPTFFRFAAADGDRVVIGSRDGAGGTPGVPKRIVWYDNTGGVTTQGTIATTAGGVWSDLGVRPGISDDGDAVAFHGNLSASGALTLGLAPGPGIFLAIRDAGSFSIQRVAGVAGNGKLDPGESYRDANGNGALDGSEQDQGVVVNMIGFEADSRVAVELQGNADEAWTLAFAARNEANQEGIFTVGVVALPSPIGGYTITSASAVIQVGDTIPDFGVVDDVAVHDGLNNQGQFAFWAKSGAANAVVVGNPTRTPVVVVPGIVGSFPSGSYADWLLNRGIEPTALGIDPLGKAYDDLIRTLENAGYVEGEDLFIAVYDWRMPNAPRDNVFDGTVTGLTGTSITDTTYEYGVDYLGYWLKQSAEQWASQHAGRPLPSVDVIGHSMGGLITRSYIQSAAYEDDYAPGKSLPKIDNFIMIATPNEGAAKAFNPYVQDNWNSDFVYRNLLSKWLSNAYHKVVDDGLAITAPSPSQWITLDTPGTITLRDPATGMLYPDSHRRFIEAYAPSVRDLLATFNFLDKGAGLTDINTGSYRNALVLDLNSGLNTPAAMGDLSSFAGSTRATVIYGTSVETISQTRERVQPLATPTENRVITPFDPDLVPPNFPFLFSRPAAGGETWYEDIRIANFGDGTVPLNSLRSRFNLDERVRRFELAAGGKVDHVNVVSYDATQTLVLRTLGIHEDSPDTPTLISIGQYLQGVIHDVYDPVSGLVQVLATAVTMYFDPVDAVVIDEQGRRLGFSSTEGLINEIPGASYFGGVDGFGLIPYRPTALTLELRGLGGNYFVAVAVAPDDTGAVSQGFLPAGTLLQIPIITATDQSPVAISDTATTFRPSPLSINVLGNDTDTDGTLDPTTVAIGTGPANGSGSVDPATGAITYTPNSGFVGTDAFTYTVRDNLGAVSNVATVTVQVNNRPPVAAADSATTAPNRPVLVSVLTNDSDPDGTLDPASVTVVGSPANGSVSVHATTGAVTYTPNVGFSGIDSFTYAVKDSDGTTSNAATVNVAVVPNARPVANADSAMTVQNVPIGVVVLANDTDTDGTVVPSTLSLVTLPANGSVSVNPGTGTVTYTPNPGFTGTDTFSYRVSDDGGESSNPATVSVSVGRGETAPPPLPISTSKAVPSSVVGSGAGRIAAVKVFNADGSVRFTVTPYPGFTGGITTAAGDLTGDGVPDIVTGAGAGGGPHVKAFDGVTGAEIRSFFAFGAAFSAGVSVASGDFTGDGRADIVVAAGVGGGPHVRIFDGLTGAEVASFYAYDPGFTGGVSVAVDESNGTLVTGTLNGPAHVRVLRPTPGKVVELQSFYAFDPKLLTGANVAALLGNIYIAPAANSDSTVRVYESGDVHDFRSFDPYPGFTGGVRITANRLGQIVTGAGAGGGPHVKVFDALTLAELSSFFAFDQAFSGGVFIG